MPQVRHVSKMSIPSIVRQLRLRAGMPKSSMHARATPPVAYQGNPMRLGYDRAAAVVAAVVEIVSVAVPALAPVMLTGVVVPKLKVGGLAAPLGLEVMAGVNVTLPVNPPLGVTVMVEVSAVVAPGDRVTAVALRVKPGGVADVTVTVAVPVAGL
jgi:hypothetical protein